MIQDKALRSSWPRKLRERQEKKLVQALARQLQDGKKREREVPGPPPSPLSPWGSACGTGSTWSQQHREGDDVVQGRLHRSVAMVGYGMCPERDAPHPAPPQPGLWNPQHQQVPIHGSGSIYGHCSSSCRWAPSCWASALSY